MRIEEKIRTETKIKTLIVRNIRLINKPKWVQKILREKREAIVNR
jgi:hypothetical protein